MRPKTFSFTAGIIFFIIALVHLSRILFGWSVMLEGWEMPFAVNWIALLVAGYMAYQGLSGGSAKR